MITPVALRDFSSKNKIKQQTHPDKHDINSGRDKINLSGADSPIKSYVSFGWCTAHYQAMYDIDSKYSQKLNNKLKEVENMKKESKRHKEKYTIVDNASVQAAKIIAQYANMQCVIAEVPPAYAVMNGGKLKQAMNESETLTNPISALIAINSLANMDVKNKNLDSEHLERGKGATQLYAIAILLNQINENKNKPEFSKNAAEINELTMQVKKSMISIYGDDIMEKLEKFGNMGKNPTHDQKHQALNFLIEVDSKAKNIQLPDDFQEKLQALLDKTNADEERVTEPENTEDNHINITIQYPDHEHSLAHINGTPHTHEHHGKDDSNYQTILDNMHSHKHDDKEQTKEQTNEQENELKEEKIKGE